MRIPQHEVDILCHELAISRMPVGGSTSFSPEDMMRFYDDMMMHAMGIKMYEKSKGNLAVQSTPKEGPSFIDLIQEEAKLIDKLYPTKDAPQIEYTPKEGPPLRREQLNTLRSRFDRRGVALGEFELKYCGGEWLLSVPCLDRYISCSFTKWDIERDKERAVDIVDLAFRKLVADIRDLLKEKYPGITGGMLESMQPPVQVRRKGSWRDKPIKGIKRIVTEKPDWWKKPGSLPNTGPIPVTKTKIEPKFTGWRWRRGAFEIVNYCGAPSERVHYAFSHVLGKDVNLATGRPVDDTHCTLKCGGYMQQVYDTQRGLHRECQKCGMKK